MIYLLFCVSAADAFQPVRVHSVLDMHDENATSLHSPSLYLFPPNHSDNYTVAGDRVMPNVVIDPKTVAIGLGFTTRGVEALKTENLHQTLTFFKTFLPSFCSTCSRGYKYNFFVAYDFNDQFLNQKDFLDSFTYSFYSFTRDKCPKESAYHLHLVRCDHTKSPAWAQNDAMMEAYLSNMVYYYRINDDTLMVTPGWTEAFIKALGQMNPKNVGVVGPTHRGGNVAILTYDFVTYHHINIFGFYYPRVYPDWFADAWITNVYKPSNSLKLKEVRLNHLMSVGTRYRHHRFPPGFAAKQIEKDKETLQR